MKKIDIILLLAFILAIIIGLKPQWIIDIIRWEGIFLFVLITLIFYLAAWIKSYRDKVPQGAWFYGVIFFSLIYCTMYLVFMPSPLFRLYEYLGREYWIIVLLFIYSFFTAREFEITPKIKGIKKGRN